MQKILTSKTLLKLVIILTVICVILVSVICFTFLKSDMLSSRVTRFELHNIGELATQSGFFTSVQVIENARDLLGVSIPFTGKKYIYSYDGIIKAGIDFQNVDISVNDIQKKISVTIPETQVFSVEIDPDSFVLYHESGNAFNPLNMDEINLAEKTLKNEIQQRAIENGLLDEARSNAELVIQAFLSGAYDLQEYTVSFIAEEGI